MGTVVILFYRIRHREKFSKLPKVTQLVSGRGRIQTQMHTHTDLESKCLLQRNAISQLGYYPQCPLQLDGDS